MPSSRRRVEKRMDLRAIKVERGTFAKVSSMGQPMPYRGNVNAGAAGGDSRPHAGLKAPGR